MCIISSSYVNSNWSYSPETVKLGCDLCDLDLWPWPFVWTLFWSLVITPQNFMMIRWWEHSQKGVTDGRTDGETERQTENTICRAAWSQLKTTTAHHHSNNHPADFLWEALKLRLPTTIVVQYKITIPTIIISWHPQLVSGSMSVRVIQGGRPQHLLPPGRRYVLKTNVNYVLYWYFLHQLVEILHRQSFIFLCNPTMLPKAFLHRRLMVNPFIMSLLVSTFTLSLKSSASLHTRPWPGHI